MIIAIGIFLTHPSAVTGAVGLPVPMPGGAFSSAFGAGFDV